MHPTGRLGARGDGIDGPYPWVGGAYPCGWVQSTCPIRAPDRPIPCAVGMARVLGCQAAIQEEAAYWTVGLKTGAYGGNTRSPHFTLGTTVIPESSMLLESKCAVPLTDWSVPPHFMGALL